MSLREIVSMLQQRRGFTTSAGLILFIPDHIQGLKHRDLTASFFVMA